MLFHRGSTLDFFYHYSHVVLEVVVAVMVKLLFNLKLFLYMLDRNLDAHSMPLILIRLLLTLLGGLYKTTGQCPSLVPEYPLKIFEDDILVGYSLRDSEFGHIVDHLFNLQLYLFADQFHLFSLSEYLIVRQLIFYLKDSFCLGRGVLLLQDLFVYIRKLGL